MKLVVVSHKLCWPSRRSPTGYATDGGFPFQLEAISELFDGTSVVVPSEVEAAEGLAPIKGRGIKIVALSIPGGTGLERKLKFPLWCLKNGRVIWRAVGESDAVHVPIPGDVGTIGMLFALAQRKPLFVRHCGNWFVQRTWAERFWKWCMEHFAGGRNVMLATGGAREAPSQRNKNIKWIFSTSLRREQLQKDVPRSLPSDGKLRIAIVCRQELRKGTDVVINSMPLIRKVFPEASLDVAGDGSQLGKFKELANRLALGTAIRFHGRLDQKSVLELLERSHVFCFPTSASEGFPKAVLEALATGLPVVATPVSALPELLRPGGGVLIREPDACALADAIRIICSNASDYTEMSVRAMETARQYSLEDWQKQIGDELRLSWGVSSLTESASPEFVV